jgi:murein DD-endopeptidase MepM/ murein hydrolase activator NlpD
MMPGLRRRLNTALSSRLSEKRVFIQSSDSTRYLRLTPLTQIMLGSVSLVAIGWMAVATATVALDRVAAETGASQTTILQEAYESRLEELSRERDQRAAEAWSAQNRFQIAMEQISLQQSRILDSVEDTRELTTALDLMRARLQDVIAQRDEAAEKNERLLAQVSEVSETLTERGATHDDLDETLQTVSSALSDAVAGRDTATAERENLAAQLAELELKTALNTMRQEEMISNLEQAIAMSFGPLEKMFKTTDLDVDSLLATVRSTHTGQGGPEERATMSTRSYDGGLDTRLDRLMIDLDRMNLMRIAVGKVPYAMPVKAGYRFTSGFGVRRDPKGRGHRMHSGVDFAAPKGTPIYATADGVVVSAKRESGYGNTVRIRHAFGFETVYAHQTKLRVGAGQKVSRGEQIGDMGSTGRSTGVHLHYEVHLHGRPVNPMTYLEAAKNVF